MCIPTIRTLHIYWRNDVRRSGNFRSQKGFASKKFGKHCSRLFLRRRLPRRQHSSQDRVGLNKGVRFILSVCKLRFADLHASCQFRCSRHQSGLLRGPAVLRSLGSYDRLGVVKGMGLSARLRTLCSCGSDSVQAHPSVNTRIFCHSRFKLKCLHQVFVNATCQ